MVMKNITKTPLQRFLLLITLILSISLQYPQPKLDIAYYSELATSYTLSVGKRKRDTSPLDGITVVITGSTSGIGLGLTKALYGLGATIVAVGRSPTKLTKLGEEVGETTLSERKRIVPIVADFQDLDSVSSAADKIKSKFKRIDFLINNAGMHSSGIGQKSSTVQGYDLVFGVNYLAPFLLTQKLLPLLERSTMRNSPRIIQITSSFHCSVDGSTLVPTKSASSSPSASQPNSSIIHGLKSYAASKLAQIYHARSLTREFQQRQSPIKILSICPLWVATNIAGSFMKNLLSVFAFESNGYGLAPILYAMFHPVSGVEDGEYNDFVSNCSIPINNKILEWIFGWHFFEITGIRQTFCYTIVGPTLLLLQKFFATVGYKETSYESFNVDNQDALFQWSKDTISPWMKK